MITLRKLQSLKTGTRKRKLALLLREMEDLMLKGKVPDQIYLKGLCRLTCEDLKITFEYPPLMDSQKVNNPDLLRDLGQERDTQLRYCNDLRHLLLQDLGQEPADWDFTNPGDSSGERQVLPLSIYLDDIRSPFNVGAVFRSAEAFGVQKVFLSPGTASPEHSRAKRTSMGASDILPWEICEPGDLDGPLFALETGGSDLDSFSFPEKGTLVIGSEELGVSPELLKRCDSEGGRVSIPLPGSKGSLNLSVAFGIVMQKWTTNLNPDCVK